MSTPILLLTTSSGFGGAEGILRDLARGLPAHGFAPQIGSLRACGPIADELRAEGLPVFSLEMRDEARLPEIFTALPRLAREIDARGIALIHSALYRANVMAPLAARLAHARPSVITAQHSIAPMTGAGASFALRRVMRLSDATIAVCEAAQRTAIERERQLAERVHLIPNAVDTQRFRPQDRAAARAALGLPCDTRIVGTLGRLSRAKALEELIRAFAGLRATLDGASDSPETKLVIVGDGEERARLEAEARELGLGRRILFLGATAQPQEVLPAFDLFVLSSREEAAPVAILEAMACGLPCIATRVGGLEETIEDGSNGVLVEPLDTVALTRAIDTLLASPERREALGRAARTRTVETHSTDAMVARHATLYRSILEEKQAA